MERGDKQHFWADLVFAVHTRSPKIVAKRTP
jgi:hypothetical protein